LPQSIVSQFESGWPQALSGCMYSLPPERGAWQSAVGLRAVCQGVIPVGAIRSICPRSWANERIPVPAIAADCLGLNYTPMVSVDRPSRDTIPLKGYCRKSICCLVFLNRFKVRRRVVSRLFLISLNCWVVLAYIQCYSYLNYFLAYYYFAGMNHCSGIGNTWVDNHCWSWFLIPKYIMCKRKYTVRNPDSWHFFLENCRDGKRIYTKFFISACQCFILM
jgi:hypothetical protein